ncbi:hypothetical protein [Mycolicibacterium fortuitum]|uniref:hypothetical protein n=1 Tax=Mycolicibacterium fortuitum TaxID=1766 RepID=UPI00096DF89C|nr:hypothetical protein [Mycolicibacterium fortuitum]OMC11150.1 hypothetical protein A5734_24345 [Mycolicibacterium fortuitum]
MIAGFLRGAADFWDAVQAARAEQRTGFSEREAGDYLDTAGLDDAVVPGFDWESETNRLALKLNSIRGLANSWRATNLDGISSGDLVLHVAAGTLLNILNEGINFWTPPEPEPDGVADAEVHCEGCKCPTICGCGRELYGEPESPDGPTYWFHRDDDSPITLQCARIPLAEPTAEELADLASRRDVLHVIPDPHEVSQEDLAAHLTGELISHSVAMANRIGERSPLVGSYPMFLAERVARSLLADYRITKK